MTTFTRTWNAAYEAQPGDTEDLDLGASRIRQLKTDIHERMEVDHKWAGDADDGAHIKVLFNAPIADPTTGTDKGALYTKDVSAKAELHFKDEDGNVVQITNAGQINLFPSGTKMLFQQTTAPTGWTKETTNVNDRALRVVSGSVSSGGTDGFSTVFSSTKATEGHALTIAEMPLHGHPYRHSTTTENQASAGDGGILLTKRPAEPGTPVNRAAFTGTPSNTAGQAIGGSGGGGSHTHDITMDLQYIDVIIATKD